MHIMEGYLPASHCAAWFAASAPAVVAGLFRIRRILADRPQARMTLAAAGAFTFVLSALKLPSVTGSCSHPTGTGLGAIIFGPSVMAVLGMIVLLFQALLLAHGGITTLGANIFSMAVVGPWVTYGLWKLGGKAAWPLALTVFVAVAFGNLATYLTTSAQLALAYPDPVSGIAGAFAKFAGIFAITQVPLAIAEGLLTIVVIDALAGRTAAPADRVRVLAGEFR